jgi:glutamate-1-semialdehyde aminotransferase
MFNNIPLGGASNSEDSTSLSMNLISYHLLYQGVFLIGNGGLLSTAHTDEDLEYVIQAVKNSINELREGGLLP